MEAHGAFGDGGGLLKPGDAGGIAGGRDGEAVDDGAADQGDALGVVEAAEEGADEGGEGGDVGAEDGDGVFDGGPDDDVGEGP